ncbi:MAG TPA: hypothetical protein VEZ90_03090 [Blastocatellia bacterium]|nr:hypothetical protein [Blastocatellia bacterium]
MVRSNPGTKEPTQQDFQRFLRLLDPDPEQAGIKYEQARQRLIYYFRKHGCLTPEDQTDKTFNRTLEKLARGENISDIERYLSGVAYYILKEYWDTAGRESSDLADLPESAQPFVDPGALERESDAARSEKVRKDCMESCFQSLPADEHTLAVRYSNERGKRERESLASSMGMTLANLRVKVHRIRVKLKKCVAGCVSRALASEI